MENWVQNVVSRWKSEGVDINHPATIALIEHTETCLNFKFPEDFKELYLEIDGFKGWNWQEHMFTLYPLEIIVDEFNDSKDKDFVGFCDFLLASHFIGFSKSKPGIYKMYSILKHQETKPIANTFEELVHLINSGADSVY